MKLQLEKLKYELDEKELKQMKSSAILTSTTGGIINLDELNIFLKDYSFQYLFF